MNIWRQILFAVYLHPNKGGHEDWCSDLYDQIDLSSMITDKT